MLVMLIVLKDLISGKFLYSISGRIALHKIKQLCKSFAARTLRLHVGGLGEGKN